MEETITKYFRNGYSYKEILNLLKHCHGVAMSLRTLKSRLKTYGLQRRGKYTDRHVEMVIESVIEYIRVNGNSHGYRNIWHVLNRSGISATRDMVMMALRELDPEGGYLRKKKRLFRRNYSSNGPNDTWHIDGYDKLKPFGFPIHGCIDGYSRKIIWLRFVKSNNSPYTVGKLYFDVVKRINKIPLRVRSDCGSENIFVAGSQCFLHRSHGDQFAGEKAHIYGSSHHNQHIEAWWSQFRHMKSQFMISFFKKMVEDGDFNADNDLQKHCMQFCFGDIVQDELDNCKNAWNSHYIRKSEKSQSHGRPNSLYHIPNECYPDQSIEIDERDLQVMEDHLQEYENNEDENDFFEYFEYLSEELHMKKPIDFPTAKQNYLEFLSYARI